MIKDEQFVLVTECDMKKIKMYTIDGQFSSIFSEEPNLKHPFALAKTQNDYIAVTDLETHMINIFNPEGILIRFFGGLGDSPSCLNYPTQIAISRDRQIIVADSGSNSVKIFSFSGILLQIIPSNDLCLQNQKSSVIRGLGCDPEDNIIAIINRNICLIIPETNRLMKIFSSADGLVNPTNFIINYSGTRIIVAESSGFNELSSTNDGVLVLKYDLDYLNTFKSFHSSSSRQNSNINSFSNENQYFSKP